MLASTVEAIRRALANAQTVLVITHVGPDGDAISVLTATGLALQQLDKTFTLVCDDGLPARFTYLPMAQDVVTRPSDKLVYDLIIALDAGDLERLGEAYVQLPEPKPPLINIDHHLTNTLFGQVNLVDPRANATAEILYFLLPKLDVILTADLATCLLTGIVTDTMGFRTAGVTANTLKAAGTLVEAGADLFEVTTKALTLKDFTTLQLWQKGLDNMRLEAGVLWTSISNVERLAAGHGGSSSFGLGNILADVYQAAMSVVLMEMSDGRVSVSLRCRPPYSVAELAVELGGGGHPLAAGCTLDGPLDKAEAEVVTKSKVAIRQQRAMLRAKA